MPRWNRRYPHGFVTLAVMNVLWEHGPLPLAAVADIVQRDRANIGKVLDNARGRGHVDRGPAPNEWRLTREGFLSLEEEDSPWA